MQIGEYTKNYYKSSSLIEHTKQVEKFAAEILEKIVTGKIGKFYNENCLLNQEFVKDDSLTIEKLVANKFNVVKFVRWEMGEGLEKRNDDFAAEVAAQSNM